ncbi:fluoride efflux transporter CrcB [Aquibacillus koreensis]|uniref:Fluoride-specific ion channel FluC n=1 Tax=Aquibacillus koreensis TaxID=279446 RepID=A0A9X4AI58_9BACI|nr:fluoride efflux transporter CrcB [Aquibacillus koreensis]MCT2535943.1 fluoride efflux transporter CrcB [Aquibacillus koreensis]MDC3420399.1 fluoride efflux transporter CrcB [Aquibacillus koreensis]
MSITRSRFSLFLLIGLGGALGASARYWISGITYSEGFPYATLMVNVIGCFLLAFITNHIVLRKLLPPILITAVTSGFIGSFTTFSTFSVETINLWHQSYYISILYVFAQVFGGLFCCYLGYTLSTRKEKNK